MNTEEPTDIEGLVEELHKVGERMQADRSITTLSTQQAKMLILLGLNVLTAILVIVLWRQGLL